MSAVMASADDVSQSAAEEQTARAEFQVRVTDTDGQPISQVEVGDEFVIEIVAHDRFETPTGFFTAYADATYNAELIDIAGSNGSGELSKLGTTYYNNTVEGPGVVSPVLATLRATATSSGILEIGTNPAEGNSKELTVYGHDDIDLRDEADYGSFRLLIGSPSVALEASPSINDAEQKTEIVLKIDASGVQASDFSADGLLAGISEGLIARRQSDGATVQTTVERVEVVTAGESVRVTLSIDEPVGGFGTDHNGTWDILTFQLSGTTGETATIGSFDIDFKVSPNVVVTSFEALDDRIDDGTRVRFTLQNRGTGATRDIGVNIVHSDDATIGNSDDQVVMTLRIRGGISNSYGYWDDLKPGESITITADVNFDTQTLVDRFVRENEGTGNPGEDAISQMVDYLAAVVIEDVADEGTPDRNHSVPMDDVTALPFDQNDDGVITPRDALVAVGSIGERAWGDLAELDSDSDGIVTPLDAATIIGHVGLSVNQDVLEEPDIAIELPIQEGALSVWGMVDGAYHAGYPRWDLAHDWQFFPVVEITSPAGGGGGESVRVAPGGGFLKIPGYLLPAAPAIDSIGDQELTVGATTPLTLVVTDSDTPPSELSVIVTSNDDSILPGNAIVLEGTGAERTLLLTPVGAGGPVSVTVMVHDGERTATTTFDVTVDENWGDMISYGGLPFDTEETSLVALSGTGDSSFVRVNGIDEEKAATTTDSSDVDDSPTQGTATSKTSTGAPSHAVTRAKTPATSTRSRPRTTPSTGTGSRPRTTPSTGTTSRLRTTPSTGSSSRPRTTPTGGTASRAATGTGRDSAEPQGVARDPSTGTGAASHAADVMEQKAIDNAFKDGQLLDDLNGSHTRPVDTSGTSNGLVNKKSSNATGTSRLGGAKSKAAYYLDFQAGLITKEEYDVFAARLGTYNTDAVRRTADTSLARG